jgi:hypothetical protein
MQIEDLQMQNGQIYDIGFVDPYIMNEHSRQHHAKYMENNLVWELRKHETKKEILFPYNFK